MSVPQENFNFRRIIMVKSLMRNQSSSLEQMFVTDLADVKVFSGQEINQQCWQNYYKDLFRAAQKLRSLTKNIDPDFLGQDEG